MIGLTKLDKFLNKQTKTRIAREVKNSAYDIIKKKGNTAYGIGMCLRNITDAIFNNSNSIFTVSSYNGQFKTCIGLPTIINRDGVRAVLNLEMTTEEKQEFNNSVKVVKEVTSKLKI